MSIKLHGEYRSFEVEVGDYIFHRFQFLIESHYRLHGRLPSGLILGLLDWLEWKAWCEHPDYGGIWLNKVPQMDAKNHRSEIMGVPVRVIDQPRHISLEIRNDEALDMAIKKGLI